MVLAVRMVDSPFAAAPIHKDWKGLAYTIEVAPEDCTGCAICVNVCPVKSKVFHDRKSHYMQPKPAANKDLGLIAMAYGNIYVASVAMGAREEHTLKVFLEAESYEGSSLIIAYSHCVAHKSDQA